MVKDRKILLIDLKEIKVAREEEKLVDPCA
jgi:hypothetical protein